MSSGLRKNKKILICMIWIAALAVLSISIYVFLLYEPVTVSFIDIGQGDSCLVQAGNGGDVLIDGGDIGSIYVLSAYLRIKNVTTLDAVFVSHFHEDHAYGIKELIEQNFRIEGLYISKEESQTDLRSEILELAGEHSIPVYWLSGDEQLEFGKVKYSILWPVTKMDSAELNNQSMVIRADYGESSVLFTGDIEAPAERALVSSAGDDIETDVLKIPHHGSKGAVYDKFFDNCSAEFAIISVGENNQYGAPSDDMLECLRKYKSTIFRTDLDGTIEVTLGKNGIRNINTTNKRR